MANFDRSPDHPMNAGSRATQRAPLPTALLALITSIGLLLAGCGGSNNQGSFDIEDVGALRVIHAVSDAPALSFFVENTSFSTVSYGQSSGFTTVNDGRFDLIAAYTTLDQETTQLYDDRVRVDRGEETTLILAGTIAAPIEIVLDTENTPVATDAVELNVLNTSGGGAMDIYLTGPGDELGSAPVTIPDNSVSGIIQAVPGTRRLRLTAAGSADVVFDSGSFELAGAQRLLIHVRPHFGPGDSSVEAAIVGSSGTSGFGDQTLGASVRIANAIGDEPGADVILTNATGTIDLPGVPSNSISQPSVIDPGSLDIAVTMETDPGTRYYAETVNLSGGQQRTLIVAGLVGDGSTTGRLALDPVRPIATSAQLNVMHGSISTGRADIYLLRDTEGVDTTLPIIANLALLGNGTLEVLAGTYRLAITQAGANTEFTESVEVNLANNKIYTVLLTDAAGGGTPPQFTLGDDFSE